MFDFLYKNAGIAVAGSRWCNEPLPATFLDVSQNKASEYMTLSNQIKKFLASNLKTPAPPLTISGPAATLSRCRERQAWATTAVVRYLPVLNIPCSDDIPQVTA